MHLTILTPTRSGLSVPTTATLRNLEAAFDVRHLVVTGEPVVAARNQLAAEALASGEPDDSLVLWLDDDAYLVPGTVARMVETLQTNPQVSLLGALYCARSVTNTCRASFDFENFSPLVIGENRKPGKLLEVAMTGAHVWLHRLDLLRRVDENPFRYAQGCLHEDAAFCVRVREAGAKIFVSTDCVAWHFEEANGLLFAPGQPPNEFIAGKLMPMSAGCTPEYVERDYGDLPMDKLREIAKRAQRGSFSAIMAGLDLAEWCRTYGFDAPPELAHLCANKFT
jgi:hypothetical protein